MFVKTRSMLMLLTSVSVLFGCNSGNGKTAVPGTDQTGKPPEVKISSDPVKLSIAINVGWIGPDEFKKYFEDPVKKKYPNISFEVYDQAQKDTTLDALIAAGTIPDIVMQSNNLPYRYTGRGLEYDIQPLIKKFNFDLSKLDPAALNSVKVSSDSTVLTGLPWTMHFSALYYNKDIFDKFGVPYPKDGMTWDDLKDLNQKMTRSDGGVQYMGYSASPNHILRMNQLSLPLFDPKTKKPLLADERWKTMLETYFVNEATANYISWSTTKKKLPYYTELTASQELAMMAFNSQFPFDGPQYVKDIDWDLVSLPTLKEKPKVGSQASPRMFAITNTAKNKDAAMEVIKYLYSDEYQTITARDGNYPVIVNDDRIKQFAQNTYYKDRNVQSIFKTKLAPVAPKTIYDPDLLGIYRKYTADLALGNVDMNTMMRKIDEEVQMKVAEIKSR